MATAASTAAAPSTIPSSLSNVLIVQILRLAFAGRTRYPRPPAEASRRPGRPIAPRTRVSFDARPAGKEMSGHEGSSARAILYAFLANLGIALAKTAAAAYTKSGSMLAE